MNLGGSVVSAAVIAPTTQATNIAFSGVTANQLTTSWTNGNGAGRVAYINTTDIFTAPATGSSPTANTVYGGGQQAIFNGTGNTATVTGLSPTTQYFVRVYEYNGSSSTTVYNTATATGNPNSVTTATPIITTTGTLNDFGRIVVGSVSSSQMYTVSGSNLTANLVVNAPSTDFQVSKDNTTFSSSVSFAPSSGSVTNQTVYVRFSPQSTGVKSGNVANTSTGATTANVPVSGTGIASVNLSVSPLTTAEGGTFRFTATANSAVTGNQVLTLSFTGTASNADFTTTLPVEITILNGQTSGFVDVVTNDDLIVEPTENANFTITPKMGASDGITSGATTTQAVTITDNDTSTIDLSVTPTTATEMGATTITVTATASKVSASNQTVTLGTSGTATIGSDYSLSGGNLSGTTLTIPAGSTTATTTFTVIDDVAIEGGETATLTISAPSTGSAIGAASQTITITDDDTTDLTITLSDAPDPVTVGGNLVYTLTVTNIGSTGTMANGVNATFTLPASGYFTTPAPTVDDGAFASNSISGNVVTFTNANFTASGAGSTTTMTVTIRPTTAGTLTTGTAVIDLSNTIIENNETNNTAPAVSTTVNNVAVPTINVAPNSLNFGSVAVGGTSAQQMYTVSGTNLTNNITITAPSNYLISTTDGSNYSSSLTLTQMNGSVQNTPIYVIFKPTATQTYSGNITNTSGTATQNVAVTGTGVQSTVNLSVAPASANEPNGTFTFTVTASPAVSGDQMVSLNLASGTANGNDFTNAFPIRITINNGATTGTAIVTIKDDLLAEGSESATFSITNPTAGIVLGATTSQTVTVTDNDNAGFIITPTTLELTENGASKTYTVALTSQPTADVTVNISPNGDLTTNVTTLTFTPADYATPKTVIVTAKDDRLAQGVRTVPIEQTSTSNDPNYNRTTPTTVVSVTVNDDDTVGLVITPLSVNVTEGGATATYTVKLNSQPLQSQDVIVHIAGGSQATTDAATLTFTAKNYDTEQTVTVTATDDAIVEGIHTQIITNRTTSGDGAYNDLTKDVTANITDNDAANITVTPTTVNVTEGGATATYTVVLTSQPTSDVTITITPDAQVMTSPTTLTFTATNYATPQTVTVTAVDDTVIEYDHTGIITQTATSADANYNNRTVSSVTANITDNDFPTVELSVTPPTANETNNGAFTFTATASNAVKGTQTVKLNLASGTASAADFTTTLPVTITIADGATTGTATVNVNDDAIVEGDETANFSITEPSMGVKLGTVTNQTVTVTDNDQSTIDLSVSPNASSEATPNNTVTLTATATKASTKPQTVTVTVSGTNITTGDFTLNTTTITIPANELTGTAILTILDDAVVEGTETATITISEPSTGSIIGIATQNVTITDNDKPTVNLTVSPNTATETDKTVVTVTATASDNVYGGDQTVKLNVSGTNITSGDYTLSDTTITIPDGTKTGSVTFTIVDDTLIEGTETAILTIDTPSSNVVIGTASQNVTITDNDFPSVKLTVDPSTASETNGVFTFTATASQAVVGTQSVKLNLNTGTSATNVDFAPTFATVTITIANGATTGTATVNVNDDAIAEGTETATFSISDATGGITIDAPNSTQIVTINDNDNATINVTPTTINVTEGGATAKYSVVLTSKPTANVTITIVSGSQLSTSTTTLIFTPDNYNVAQEVTVTAVDDNLVEGTHTATITQTAASDDTNYNGATIADVTATITDNDKPTVNLSVSPNTATEADATTVTVTATASDNVYGGNQTVDVTVSGTNITTGDYAFNGATTNTVTITIPNGTKTGTATFKVIDDAIVEGTETATLTLNNPSTGIALGTTTTQNVTITDNDFNAVTFSASPLMSSEAGATLVTLTATALQPVTGNQTVTLTLTGTATAADFDAAIPTTITILDGQTSGFVTVKVTDDAIVEGTETATFTISSPSNGISLGTKTSDDVTIVDNDKTAVNLLVTSNTGLESGLTQITVTATASDNVYGGDQSVDLNLTGTATNGTDYVLTNTKITIPNGMKTGSVTFTVSNDLTAEGTETAILTIVNPSANVTIGTNKTETISITDDDITDLTVKVSAPMSANRYVTYNYVATISNISDVDAENVQVNFTLPHGNVTLSYKGYEVSAESNFVCANPDANRTIVCTGGKLAKTAAPFAGKTNESEAIKQTATITFKVSPNENGTLDNKTSDLIVDPNNALLETDDTNNTANLATSSGNPTTTVNMVTAAGINASGKVINAKSRGIARVNVTILDTTTNETRSTFTTLSGDFNFDGLAAGRYYIVTVNAKRFTFDENQQGFQPFENTVLTFQANR